MAAIRLHPQIQNERISVILASGSVLTDRNPGMQLYKRHKSEVSYGQIYGFVAGSEL